MTTSIQKIWHRIWTPKPKETPAVRPPLTPLAGVRLNPSVDFRRETSKNNTAASRSGESGDDHE